MLFGPSTAQARVASRYLDGWLATKPPLSLNLNAKKPSLHQRRDVLLGPSPLKPEKPVGICTADWLPSPHFLEFKRKGHLKNQRRDVLFDPSTAQARVASRPLIGQFTSKIPIFPHTLHISICTTQNKTPNKSRYQIKPKQVRFEQRYVLNFLEFCWILLNFH